MREVSKPNLSKGMDEGGLSEFPPDFNESTFFRLNDRDIRFERLRIYKRFVREAKEGRPEFWFHLDRTKQDKIVILAEIHQRFKGRLYVYVSQHRIRIDKVDAETIEDEWRWFVLSNTDDPYKHENEIKF
jgi:flavin-dependent dehydrogenase